MVERYYFVIEFVPEHADNELLAGRCIQTLHGFMGANSQLMHKLGVCFPYWSSESVGKAIAFIGTNEKDLVGLSYQPYFSRMVSEGLFEISNIQPVPNGLPEVRFVRNQTIGKMFVASKKRRIERSMRRNAGHTPKPSEDREFELFHKIPIASQKSGQDFVLHIQKQVPENNQGSEFNSYGFGSPVEWDGTVPDLCLTLFSKKEN